MAGIGVVLNPRSRRNLRDPRAADRLARALGDHGVVRTARSRDDLARIATDYRKLGIDVLGISGGDGTNHVTITGFLEAYAGETLPPIALLRGGTMNTVANSLGVPRGGPDGLLRDLAARYANRTSRPLRSVERHVMRVGPHVGFLFGTGAIHGFLSAYYERPEPNAVWAAQVLARAMASVATNGELMRQIAKRWEGKVYLDNGDELPDRDYLAIGAGTIDQIGLGFRPFYRAGHERERFHLLGIHTSATGFVQKLPDVWRGRPMGDEHTYDRLVRSAVLEARNGVVEYMCDGDLHAHPGPLEVEIGPRVRIVVGLAS